jgi:uncharacterized paraquat-inducible protein A
MSANAPVAIGPQCPHCNVALAHDWVHSGTIVCPHCSRSFLAEVFQPPRRIVPAVEAVEAFPEGANSCANHPANAAVTSCQRCGLLICTLCEMNIGEGPYCPSCFDRVRAEGELRGAATRSLDYASMARLSALAGLVFSILFLGIPIGGLTLYYARKGAKQRSQEGDSAWGMMVLTIVGILEVLGGLALIGFFIWAAFKGGK